MADGKLSGFSAEEALRELRVFQGFGSFGGPSRGQAASAPVGPRARGPRALHSPPFHCSFLPPFFPLDVRAFFCLTATRIVSRLVDSRVFSAHILIGFKFPTRTPT